MHNVSANKHRHLDTQTVTQQQLLLCCHDDTLICYKPRCGVVNEPMSRIKCWPDLDLSQVQDLLPDLGQVKGHHILKSGTVDLGQRDLVPDLGQVQGHHISKSGTLDLGQVDFYLNL